MKFTNKDQLIAELYEAAQSKGFIAKTLKELPGKRTPSKIIKYLKECVKYCETQMQIAGVLNLPLAKLRNIGEYNIPGGNGKKDYVWYLCQRNIKFFIIDDTGNGKKGTLSTGMITKTYKDILMKYEQTQAPVKIVNVVDSILGKAEVNVPVKLNRSRIKDAILTQQYFNGKKQNGDKRIEKLEAGGREISQLKWLLKNMDQNDEFIQTFEQKSTGRLYSKSGTHTLLSVSKKVRNIAAPKHTIVDINSACFSVFLKIYNQIQKDSNFYQPLTHIEYYVGNPKKVRLDIVKDICERHYADDFNFRPPPSYNTYNTEYKMVKEAFTAIGFGAKTPTPSSTGYNACYWITKNGVWETDALNGVLKSKTDYFVTNQFVEKFVEELIELNKFILSQFETDLEEEHMIYPGVTIDRKRTPQKQLALIYQSMERQMLDYMYDVIPTDQIMALIHDGIMIKPQSDPLYIKKIVEENINKKLVILRPNDDPIIFNGGNDIKVSLEHINNDYLNEQTDNITQAQQLEDAHREHMANELHEAAIADYEPQFATPSVNVDPNATSEVTLADVKALVDKKPIAEKAAEKITVASLKAMCHKPKAKVDKGWSTTKEEEWQKKTKAAVQKFG